MYQVQSVGGPQVSLAAAFLPCRNATAGLRVWDPEPDHRPSLLSVSTVTWILWSSHGPSSVVFSEAGAVL